MLVYKKTGICFAIELSSREISFILYVHTHAQMMQKSCAVGMRNAILRNHLNRTHSTEWKEVF